MPPATGASHRPLGQPLGGTSGDWRHRLLRFHLPLAVASTLVLILFMRLPIFDASVYPHADTFSGTLPQQRSEGGSMAHGGDQTAPREHDGGHAGPRGHGGGHAGTMEPDAMMEMMGRRVFVRQITVATGYLATGLLALTLLIGPVNLLLRRRNPVSSYLRRDVGMWTAVASVVHTIFGLQVHGSGRLADFLGYFVAPDGTPWLNSFGLANWTGLAELVIVVGLLAASSDYALGKLKAGPWKWLQRLNYALFALVLAHAFFYGALLRMTSPYTLLLGLLVIAVFVGQAAGIWLWRRRNSRTTARLA